VKIYSVTEFRSKPDGCVDYIIRVTHDAPDEHDRIYSVRCEAWLVADWGDESGASEECWRVSDSPLQGYRRTSAGLPPSEPSTNLDAHECSWELQLKWDGCSNWTYNTDHYCNGLEGLLAQQAVERECFRQAIEVMRGSYDGD